MVKFYKIENEPGLIKDTQSGAVLSIDKESLKKHRVLRRRMNQKNDEIADLKARLLKLENFLGLTDGSNNT